MNILFFDLESAPSTAHIWELYKEVTSMEMVESDWYVLCFGAKWLGEKEVISSALPDHKLYRTEKDNDREVMKDLWKLLDKADIVIAHNAIAFDVRKANARFIYHGMTPPSPYKIVDTLKVARRYFSFMSNRLGDLGKFLGVGTKIDTGGFRLWRGCLSGDKKSWGLMVKYCRQDVLLLERVYLRLRPYIKVHPSRALQKEYACPKCGSADVHLRGTAKAVGGIDQRFCCQKCGGWGHIRIRNWTKLEREALIKND